MIAEVVAQHLDHICHVVLPISRYTRSWSAVEPDLGFGAVEAKTRSGPRCGHRVKCRLHLGEGQDEVEVVDVRAVSYTHLTLPTICSV
eukprot:8125855-Prorocentrum_lima.AAC.1